MTFNSRLNYIISSPEDIPEGYEYIKYDYVKGARASTFFAHDQKIFILAPDNLKSVTSVVGYEGNFSHVRYLLSNFFGNVPLSESLIVGNVVGTVFQAYCELKISSDLELNNYILSELSSYEVDICILSLDKYAIAKSIHPLLLNLIKLFPLSILKNVRCEVDMISPLYGLRGRLDFQSIAGANMSISELKTSSPPRKADVVWDSHVDQVVCYKLMSEINPNWQSVSLSILYPKSDDFTIRQVIPSPEVVRSIIDARNNIVQNDILVSRGDLGIIFDLASTQIDNPVPQYMKSKKTHLKKILTMRESEDARLVNEISKRIGFFQKEIDHGQSMFSRLWRTPLEDKVLRREIISSIKLNKIVDSKLYFSCVNNSGIKVNDRVVLYRGSGHSPSDSVRYDIASAVVSDVSFDSLVLYTDNNKLGLMLSGEYSVERDYSPSIMSRCQRSILDFFSSSHRSIDLYFNDLRPSKSREKVSITEDYGLNAAQNLALVGALSAKDYFLIWGPPGAGKTQFLAVLINELVKKGDSVLLSGFTNTAVDNTLDRYKSMFCPVSSIRISGSRISVSQDEIESSDVVALTAFGAQYNKVFECKSFDVAIIEESSQLLDEHMLYILSKVKKVIMVGDHMQLPPIVTQHQITPSGYSCTSSIFERMYLMCQKKKYDHAIQSLLEQYRMTPLISDYVSTQFYEGRLISRVSPSSGDGLYFIEDSTSPESPLDKSNDRQACQVVSIVKSILRSGFTSRDIGIIAPFRAQVSLIKSKIGNNDIEVDTVERYQGREKSVIIFSSTVRNSETLKLMTPFDECSPDKKLNVAVSRAKHRFYLLGNSSVLSKRKEYSAYINDKNMIKCSI